MIPTRLEVKRMFFDSKKVLDAVDQSKIKALSKAGGIVRKTARWSIRKPGKTQQNTNRSVQSRRKKSNEPGNRITRLQYGYAKHALGLSVTRRMDRGEAGQLIREAEGDQGILRSIVPPARRGKAPLNRTGQLKNNIFFGYDFNQGTTFVGPTITRRGTADALEHGGQVKLTSGPRKGKTVSVSNPFMQPALEKVAPKFPALFANTIK